MAKNESSRIRPKLIVEDIASFSVLEGIADYNPSNNAYILANGITKKQLMLDLQSKETQINASLKSVRDDANAAEWDFHNYILGVKVQVSAQYGESSNELQGLGLKKKDEYKKPGGKKKPSENGE